VKTKQPVPKIDRLASNRKGPLGSLFFLGVILGSVAIAASLQSCSTGFAGSKKPEPRTGIQDPNKSPEETNTANKREVETKSLTFELQPAPPESWWNNCVVATFNGKSVDLGCSKTDGGLKTVKMDVPKDTTCGALSFQVKTFKNVGDTCKNNLALKKPCAGPYAGQPDLIRSTLESADQTNFQWTDGKDGADASLKFEDQASKNIATYEKDKSKAAALGIDFNDVVLSVKAPGIAIKLAAPSKSGESPNTEKSICP
jgi:hypothetical protein